MTKRYQFTLSDEHAKVLDEKLLKHGFNTIGEAVRKAFKLEEARHLPWLHRAKVCQPGASAEDTLAKSEQDDGPG